MNHQFVPGDIVKIDTYLVGRLWIHEQPSHHTGKNALVIEVQGDDVGLRLLDGSWEYLIISVAPSLRPPNVLTLVEKSKGPPVEGVDYQLSKMERDRLDYLKWQEANLAADYTHEGFKNPATFLAVTYLRNDGKAHIKLRELRRKSDGGLHPKKVQKLFQALGMKVDAWAYGPKVEAPQNLYWCHKAPWESWLAAKTCVDWGQVATTLAADLRG